jgi:hypothetical protein
MCIWEATVQIFKPHTITFLLRDLFLLNPVVSIIICSVLFHFMFVLCFRFSRPCLFNDKWIWGLTFVHKPVKLINYLSVCRAWWRTKSGPNIRSVYMTCFHIACSLCHILGASSYILLISLIHASAYRGVQKDSTWDSYVVYLVCCNQPIHNICRSAIKSMKLWK